MKIPNITYKEYLSLEDRKEYNYYLRYGEFKPIDHFGFKDLLDESFGTVKDLQEILNYKGLTYDELFDLGVARSGKSISELADLGIFTLQEQIVFFQEQIEQINKLESENLGHEPEPDEIEAGIDMFEKYRSAPQFRNIMTTFTMKMQEVRELNYAWVFTELKYQADFSEYQNNLMRIKNRKK